MQSHRDRRSRSRLCRACALRRPSRRRRPQRLRRISRDRPERSALTANMRRAARSSTSSSSFKRTALSTISSTAFPGRTTAKYGYDNTDNKIAASAGRARNDVGYRPQLRLVLEAACNGTGSYPGHGLPDERLRSRSTSAAAATAEPCPNRNPPYSYVPHDETKPYFYHGQAIRARRSRCTPRTSTRAALSRTSTSSPARRSRR